MMDRQAMIEAVVASDTYVEVSRSLFDLSLEMQRVHRGLFRKLMIHSVLYFCFSDPVLINADDFG